LAKAKTVVTRPATREGYVISARPAYAPGQALPEGVKCSAPLLVYRALFFSMAATKRTPTTSKPRIGRNATPRFGCLLKLLCGLCPKTAPSPLARNVTSDQWLPPTLCLVSHGGRAPSFAHGFPRECGRRKYATAYMEGRTHVRLSAGRRATMSVGILECHPVGDRASDMICLSCCDVQLTRRGTASDLVCAHHTGVPTTPGSQPILTREHKPLLGTPTSSVCLVGSASERGRACA
jgi:hypothetical protein